MLYRDAHDTKIMWDSPLQNVKEVLKGFPQEMFMIGWVAQ